MKTSTLQDVAREAGVSTATVSRTLSHPEVVTESTRKRVSEAVKVTGYRINRAARNLRTQKTHSILVLLPDLANPFFSNLLEGISRHLSSRGYSMLIASTKQVHDGGDHLVDYLDDAQADGLIVLDGQLAPEVVSSLESKRHAKRVLFACEWMEGVNIPSVRCENRKGTRAAIEHLHNLGHRKIAHITGPSGNVLTQVRRDAFVDAASDLKLDARPDWIIPGDFTLSAGCIAAKSWLALEDRPTAVFCASDQIALGFMAELARNDLKVPDDVSVVGFDDIDLAEQYIPSLTSIHQDRIRIGETAAQMLLEQLDSLDEPCKKRTEIIPVSLIVRQSTAELK